MCNVLYYNYTWMTHVYMIIYPTSHDLGLGQSLLTYIIHIPLGLINMQSFRLSIFVSSLLICIRMTTAAYTWLVNEQLWEIGCQSYVHNQCCQCIEKVTHRYTISVRTYILELSDNYRSGCAWSLHHNGVYSHILHLTHISRHLKAVVVAYPLV